MSDMDERIEFVKRRITERRKLAEDFRASASSKSAEEAATTLRTAHQCDDMASGMEMALLILFPLGMEVTLENLFL